MHAYLSITSSHARHTFSGIIKSQLYRLRRLCSLQADFESAVDNLRERCLLSGYSKTMVDDILGNGKCLDRKLQSSVLPENLNTHDSTKYHVRLVVLSGTPYENLFVDFAKRVNSIPTTSYKIDIVRTTGPTLGRMLFNNSNPPDFPDVCVEKKCTVCDNDIKDESGILTSSTTGNSYKLGRDLNCGEGGIYAVTGKCSQQYVGKTVSFGKRMKDHLKTKSTSIYCYKQNCKKCRSTTDFHVIYVESYHDRGKYTLSEREFLWNWRVRGSINLQKNS